MGFSRKIKEDVLVAAGRRCAVCKEFAGRLMNIHHIVQEAKGGKNTFSNAIPLCLVCHGEAGHYNSSHPIGIKYSKEELRRHRDQLYDDMKNGKLNPAEERKLVYERYYIIKSHRAFQEYVNQDYTHMPEDKIRVLDTEYSRLYYSLANSSPSDDKFWIERELSSVVYEIDDDLSYNSKYTDVIHEKSALTGSHCRRIPTEECVKRDYKKFDNVTKYLIDSKIPPPDVYQYEQHYGLCGDEETLMESYVLRPLWPIILIVRNISTSPVILRSMHGLKFDGNIAVPVKYHQARMDAVSSEIPFPEVHLQVDECVAIPLGIFLGPFGCECGDLHGSYRYNIKSPYYQQVSRESLSEQYVDTLVLGSCFFPETITVSGDTEINQDIHALDLTNVYTVSRDFACGCCPHILFLDDQGCVIEVNTILSKACDKSIIEQIIVPANGHKIIIIEIEDEVTVINEIWKNGKSMAKGFVLNKGEYSVISVKPGDVIEMLGKYIPRSKSITKHFHTEFALAEQLKVTVQQRGLDGFQLK